MSELTPEFIASELNRFAEIPPQTGEIPYCISMIAAALVILLKRSDWID